MKNPPANPRSFRRHALALIASGAVLGLGATAVLANWTDVERAFDEFGTSSFALEGAAQNLDGTWEPFANHNPTAGTLEAKLEFGEVAARVHPGMIVGAQYKVRLTSDLPGEVFVHPQLHGKDAAVPLADFMETITLFGGESLNNCTADRVSRPGDFERNGANGRALQFPAGVEEVVFCFMVRFNESNAQGEPLPQGSTTDLNKISWAITAESGHRTSEAEGAALRADGTWAPYVNPSVANDPFIPLDFGDAATPVHAGLVVGTKYKVRLTSDSDAPSTLRTDPLVFGEQTLPLFDFMEAKTIATTSDAQCDGSAVDFDTAVDIGDRPIAVGDEHFYCALVRFNGVNASGERLPEGSTANLNEVPWVFWSNR